MIPRNVPPTSSRDYRRQFFVFVHFRGIYIFGSLARPAFIKRLAITPRSNLACRISSAMFLKNAKSARFANGRRKGLVDNLWHSQSFNARHKPLISRRMESRGANTASPRRAESLWTFSLDSCSHTHAYTHTQGVPDFFSLCDLSSRMPGLIPQIDYVSRYESFSLISLYVRSLWH